MDGNGCRKAVWAVSVYWLILLIVHSVQRFYLDRGAGPIPCRVRGRGLVTSKVRGDLARAVALPHYDQVMGDFSNPK